ncbi:MAG TPA: hypothetical protein VF733_01385 [Candidatus Saccharimonadales bacterium]
MTGGNFALLSRAIGYGRIIPWTWWLPQKERLLLAVASIVFWGGSIVQSFTTSSHGASVFALYGLGLMYLLCSLANVTGGLYETLDRPDKDKEQTRALAQLFLLLALMFLCNCLVLGAYLARGTSLTELDILSAAAAAVVVVTLVVRYDFRSLFFAPMVRGILALTFKAVPQLILGAMFLVRPEMAQALTPWSLLGLSLMAVLRFWPSILAYGRDRASKPLRGLALGESGNMTSVVVLAGAWLIAR